MEVAAEVADWVNFSDFQITYVRCGERVGFLREGSPHFGRDPAAPRFSIGRDEEEARASLRREAESWRWPSSEPPRSVCGL